MQNAVLTRQRFTEFWKLLLFVFALLVSNAARGLASGLAGSLAFAATAVFNSLLDIFGFNSFDSLHGVILPIENNVFTLYTVTQICKVVKRKSERSRYFHGFASNFSTSRWIMSESTIPRDLTITAFGAFSSVSSWAELKSEHSKDQTVQSIVWDLRRKSLTLPHSHSEYMRRSVWYGVFMESKALPSLALCRRQSRLLP